MSEIELDEKEVPKRCFVNIYRDAESGSRFISNYDYLTKEDALLTRSSDKRVTYIETVEIIRDAQEKTK